MAKTSTSYSGQNQTENPRVDTLDASTLSLTVGGARLVQLALAELQLIQMSKNLDLAKLYFLSNEQDFTFWRTTYNPKMLSALTEGMARPFYTTGVFTPQFGALDYNSSTGRGQSKAPLKMDREWLNARRRISKYNVGVGRRVDYKFAMSKFNSELEGWNLGFRYEDNRKLMYDEQRHAHQAEILNLGIGAGNAARQGLATSVQTLSEARSERGSTFGALGNGVGRLAGQFDTANTFKQMTNARLQKQMATASIGNDEVGGLKVIPDVTKQQIDKASATA